MSMASNGVKRLVHLYRGVLLHVRSLQWEQDRGRHRAHRPDAPVLETFEPRLLLNGVLTALGSDIAPVEGVSSGAVTVANFTDADTADTATRTLTARWTSWTSKSCWTTGSTLDPTLTGHRATSTGRG